MILRCDNPTPQVGLSLDEGAPATKQTARPSPLRVLVIDDEAGLRCCVAHTIRGAGHQVEEAASSAEGVRRLQAGPLDVVLTDLHMPGGSGWEVVRAAHALQPDLPVLVMTGDADALEADGGAAALTAGILIKPFHLQDVLDSLCRIQEISGTPMGLSLAGAGATAAIG